MFSVYIMSYGTIADNCDNSIWWHPSSAREGGVGLLAVQMSAKKSSKLTTSTYFNPLPINCYYFNYETNILMAAPGIARET